MNEQTIQCPICKQPYKVYPFYAGDQSACPSCRAKAEKNMKGVFTNADGIRGMERGVKGW